MGSEARPPYNVQGAGCKPLKRLCHRNLNSRLVGKLLHRDPLIERMFGIEQQGQRARAVERHVDRADFAHFELVGDRRHRPLVGFQHLKLTDTSSGRIAPDQRRGRNGLIEVRASIFAASGRIGPWAERL